MIDQLEAGKLNITKLKRLFSCISEPNNKKQRRSKANASVTDNKGHGRTHSDAYVGAEEIQLNHDTLKVGDNCPIEDCTGKL